MRKIVTALSLLVTVSAAARMPLAPFQQGDVIVASAEPACATDPPPPPTDQISLHGPDGRLVRDVSGELIVTARYAQGFIYAAHSTPSGSSLDILASTGGFSPVLSLPSAARVTALGASGDLLLAVVYDGAQPSLWRYSLDQVVIVSLPQYQHYIDSIDVAADRCTMFYTTGDSIERFDLCTNKPLATFTRTYATAVRVLPDGGIIAASGRDLLRYDAVGNRIARFTLTSGAESIGAIALDPNPSLVWIVTTFNCGTGPSRIMQVSTGTGSITTGPQRIARSAGFAITVQGEWRAAVDKAPSPPRRRAVH